MNRRNTLLMLLTLIFLAGGMATNGEQWAHIYAPIDNKPGFILDKLIPFSGGGYVGIGYSCVDESCNSMTFYLGRIDSHGNIIWSKQLPLYYACTSLRTGNISDNNDGTFTITGLNAGDGMVVFDKNGNVLKARSYYSIYPVDSFRNNDGKIYSLVTQTSENVKLACFDGPAGEALYSRGFDFGGDTFTCKAIVHSADDNILMIGIGHLDEGGVVLKTDLNGNVLWARKCEGIYEDSMGESLIDATATSDGGLLFLVFPEHGSIMPNTIIKLDRDGNVSWQEQIHITDTLGTNPAHILDAEENDDKTILVSCLSHSDNPVTILLDNNGQIIKETQINVPWYSLVYIPEIIKTDDGFVFIGHGPWGFSCFDWMGIAGTIGTLDHDGIPLSDCYEYENAEAAIVPTSLIFSDFPVTSIDGYEIYSYASDYSLIDVSQHVISCGDVWPAVLSAKKLSNPFRLKLTGWNFTQGSEVYVNGVKAAKASYKGTDAYNHTKLVVSGAGLKTLLPKGQPVCITVKNPDGHESECFSYTR